MSWRIATSQVVEGPDGLDCPNHFDFVIGRDGTADDAVAKYAYLWPIVVFDTEEGRISFQEALERADVPEDYVVFNRMENLSHYKARHEM